MHERNALVFLGALNEYKEDSDDPAYGSNIPTTRPLVKYVSARQLLSRTERAAIPAPEEP